MKFSIIIPTYKGCDTIEIAIQSVLNQTYNNCEIIISDDNIINSHEQKETSKIVKRLQSTYSNIVYLANGHHNGSYARNKGIEVSKGDFIAFLDDDDLYLDQCLERTLLFFNKYPDVNIIFHDVLVANKNNTFKHVTKQNLNPISILYGSSEIGTGSNIFLRKDGFNSLHFDETYVRHQDIEFIVKLLNKTKYYWNKEIQIIKYYNHSNNYPNKKIYLEMQKKLRDDMLVNHIITSSEYETIHKKQLHVIFKDFLLNRANIKDIEQIISELKEKNAYNLYDAVLFSIYKLSKPLFFSISNFYLLKKANKKNKNTYNMILNKRKEIIKQTKLL